MEVSKQLPSAGVGLRQVFRDRVIMPNIRARILKIWACIQRRDREIERGVVSWLEDVNILSQQGVHIPPTALSCLKMNQQI